MGWQSSGQERKKRLGCPGPPKGWADRSRRPRVLPIDKPPTTAELESLPFSDLVFCLIKNREHRHLFVKEVWARITRDFDQARLVEELAKDPAIKAKVLKANHQPSQPKAHPQPHPQALDLGFKDTKDAGKVEVLKTDRYFKKDVHHPEVLLRDDSGRFTPLTKSWDGEFPAWAICQAIRSTSWKGEGLKAYNPRDVLKFLDEMVERGIVAGFDSDDQERMLKSIVGKFNAWASENLNSEVHSWA